MDTRMLFLQLARLQGNINLIKGCIQFWCVDRVYDDRIKIMLKVFNCLVQKGVIFTPWFNWEVGQCSHLTCETRIICD